VKILGELLMFRREEWVAPDEWDVLGASVSALAGCAACVGGTHPDSELGDMLDVLRGDVQVKRGSWEWVP